MKFVTDKIEWQISHLNGDSIIIINDFVGLDDNLYT